MKFFFNFLLIVGGIGGLFIAFMGQITVDSTLIALDGVKLSMALGVLSVIIMVNGIVNLFST